MHHSSCRLKVRPLQWWSGHWDTTRCGADTETPRATPVHCSHLISPSRTSEINYIRDYTPALPQAPYSPWNKQLQAISNRTRELERRGGTVRRKHKSCSNGEESREMRWSAKELKPNIYEYQTHYYFQNSRHLLAGARSRKKTKRFLTRGWENYGDAIVAYLNASTLWIYSSILELDVGEGVLGLQRGQRSLDTSHVSVSVALAYLALEYTILSVLISPLLSTWVENSRGEIDLWPTWSYENVTLGADKERRKAS